jgi:hypothetical protein
MDNRDYLLGLNAMVAKIIGQTNHIEPLNERDHLLRFNIMLEIINRQPQPLEPLMNLD